jgi:hypothetical protein
VLHACLPLLTYLSLLYSLSLSFFCDWNATLYETTTDDRRLNVKIENNDPSHLLPFPLSVSVARLVDDAVNLFHIYEIR